MKKFFVAIITACLGVAAISAFADTLELRNGSLIKGTFVGASQAQMSFRVGSRIQHYPITDVAAVRFDSDYGQTSDNGYTPQSQQNDPRSDSNYPPQSQQNYPPQSSYPAQGSANYPAQSQSNYPPQSQSNYPPSQQNYPRSDSNYPAQQSQQNYPAQQNYPPPQSNSPSQGDSNYPAQSQNNPPQGNYPPQSQQNYPQQPQADSNYPSSQSQQSDQYPQPPAPPISGDSMNVPSGTRLSVRMVDAIDSNRNQVGDRFVATLDQPLYVNDVLVVGRGANVYGRLEQVQQSGQLSGRTQLRLSLTGIVIDGQTYPLTTGNYDLSSKSRGTSTAQKVGGGAALGAVIGAIAGGGRGAAIGAGVGAGAGTAVQIATKGEQIHVPSETVLDFTLDQPVTLPTAGR